MLKKELEGLLAILRANEEAVNDVVDKFHYTFEVACDMVEVYNYVINALEEDAVFLPPTFKKIDANKYENEIKKIYEIISYRSDFLIILIKNEIKKIEDKDVFEDLEKFEEKKQVHVTEKIILLEDEIKEGEEEVKFLESEIVEFEKELEQIISTARSKKCDNAALIKEAANTNLDIQKMILKIEKNEREIDRRKENISRKKNEISILKFQLKK